MFRGLEAERELIATLTHFRVAEILDGDEPKFGEVLEIARILRVPLSTFQIFNPGDFPELEIAYVSILYAASEMNAKQRERLADKMIQLVTSEGEGKHSLDADITSVTQTLRRKK